MRAAKLILIIVLIIVSLLYGYTGLSQSIRGKDTPPVLTAEQNILEVSVTDGTEALYAGLTATDRQDGDLTHKIQISGISKLISNNTVKVSYIVFDSADNLATLTRQVRYTDYTKPRFTLSEPLNYRQHQSIALLDRLGAVDAIDGDITDMIRVSPLSVTQNPEIYAITCQVTNAMGDTVVQILPVIQYTGTAPRPEVLLKEYLTYLPVGAAFNPRSYLTGVKTPEGTGSTSDVIIDGTVDTQTPGTYMVRYTYPNSNGNGISILTVVVE